MKVAVIGAGRMGLRHVQVVRSLGLDLVGLCDARPEALQQALQGGVEAALHFSDARAMLEARKPDCVVVSTTCPSHAALTCLAAESGASHVLCEKPMASSLAECDQMLEACAQSGTKLAINHQMRFMEQYTLAREIVRSEEFGGLGSVTVIAGNFGIAMNGSHYFEMFRYLTDEPAAEAAAWFSPNRVANPRGPEFEDRAGSIRLETASGRRFYLEVGDDQGHGVRVVYAGRCGVLVVDELAGRMSVDVRDAPHRREPTTRYGMPGTERSIRIEPADSVAPSRAVLDALLHGEDWPTGEDGRLAVATLVAAYQSDESGHAPVRIDGRLPRERRFPWA